MYYNVKIIVKYVYTVAYIYAIIYNICDPICKNLTHFVFREIPILNIQDAVTT